MTNEEVLVSERNECDFCSKEAFVDGKTEMGSWAFMCERHFREFGVGLGLGKGQKLKVVVK